MILMSIIVLDILTGRIILTCSDDGTILAQYFINVPDMKVDDASEISEMGMQWKHKILIHGTVKHMHTKQDGKQP